MPTIEKDLRTYLSNLAGGNELYRVSRQVDPKTEAPALIDAAIRKGKAVLFERVADSAIPLIGNSIGSRTCLERSVGCDERGITSWFAERSSGSISPILIPRAPVHEVMDDRADLTKFPVLTAHEADAGPYITGGICVQRDPETGKQNVGYYSLQLRGKNRLGLRMLPSTHGYAIFQKRLKKGLRAEMAVVIGAHPIEMLAAASHTLFDEFALAGALRGQPVELVNCTGIDVAVPAHAEIVLEGIILADEMEPEGPIGDWLGYYPLVERRHIFQVERVTHRSCPVYQTILSGSAEENLLLSISRAADALRAAKKAVGGVADISLDPFLPVCIIKVRKQFDGEPMNALLAAFGEVPFLKIGIAVDEDVDITNMNDVLWAVVTRSNLEKDVNVLKNVLGFSRDPFDRYKSKIAIDATAPLKHKEHFRRAKVVNADIDLESYIQSTK